MLRYDPSVGDTPDLTNLEWALLKPLRLGLRHTGCWMQADSFAACALECRAVRPKDRVSWRQSPVDLLRRTIVYKLLSVNYLCITVH